MKYQTCLWSAIVLAATCVATYPAAPASAAESRPVETQTVAYRPYRSYYRPYYRPYRSFYGPRYRAPYYTGRGYYRPNYGAYRYGYGSRYYRPGWY